MSEVSLIKCDSYQQKKVDNTIRESIELIGGLSKIICNYSAADGR